MKPIYVRELKELSPALLLILAGAIGAGTAFTGPLSREFDDLLAFPIAAGLALGIAQGVLDRWRRNDAFALHRPVPAARMEAARALAGLTVAVLGLLVFVATHRISTLVEIADFARVQATGMAFLNRVAPDQLGGVEMAMVSGLLTCAWAAARFAAGSLRVRWALPALVVVPILSWSLLSHTRTTTGATGFAFVFAALFALGSGLCLAGDRR